MQIIESEARQEARYEAPQEALQEAGYIGQDLKPIRVKGQYDIKALILFKLRHELVEPSQLIERLSDDRSYYRVFDSSISSEAPHVC